MNKLDRATNMHTIMHSCPVKVGNKLQQLPAKDMG